jgi:hypothetical protein
VGRKGVNLKFGKRKSDNVSLTAILSLSLVLHERDQFAGADLRRRLEGATSQAVLCAKMWKAFETSIGASEPLSV